MKQFFRRIVIPAVFLLALGLIFLPMIFDGEEPAQAPLTSRIPVPPAVPELAEPVQTRPVILADTPAINVPEEQRAVADPAQPWREIPRLDEQGLPRGWGLRLGQFSDAEQAEQMLERLLAAGYRAYIRRQQAESGALSLVLAGPWLARETALGYQAALAEELGISGAIVPYELPGF